MDPGKVENSNVHFRNTKLAVLYQGLHIIDSTIVLQALPSLIFVHFKLGSHLPGNPTTQKAVQKKMMV